jgi:hypothetical protein
MARGRLEATWSQTAQLSAVMFNMLRGADEPGRTANDFNPMVTPKWVPVEMSEAEWNAHIDAKLGR